MRDRDRASDAESTVLRFFIHLQHEVAQVPKGLVHRTEGSHCCSTGVNTQYWRTREDLTVIREYVRNKMEESQIGLTSA